MNPIPSDGIWHAEQFSISVWHWQSSFYKSQLSVAPLFPLVCVLGCFTYTSLRLCLLYSPALHHPPPLTLKQPLSACHRDEMNMHHIKIRAISALFAIARPMWELLPWWQAYSPKNPKKTANINKTYTKDLNFRTKSLKIWLIKKRVYLTLVQEKSGSITVKKY